MWKQRAIVFAGMLLLASWSVASPRNFKPDVTFTGSSLNNWHKLGQADWTAQNGEITGKPTGGNGGWLVLDKSFQDFQIQTSYKCAEGCKTGILFRAEKTADGGMKGVFFDMTPGELKSYEVVLDSKGNITKREELPRIMLGTFRIPPPPRPGGFRGRGGFQGPPPMPNGIPEPAVAVDTSFRNGDWNTIEVVLDSNMLRPFLNNGRQYVEGGRADDQYGAYGPVALYVGGNAQVQFKEVAYRDISYRHHPTEELSSHFRKQMLTPMYYSWGPPVADINHDGIPDIVVGPYYYLGPNYTEAKEIYVHTSLNPGTEYFNGAQYAADFTGDGWPDVLNAEFTHAPVLYVNPAGQNRRWEEHVVGDKMSSEMYLVNDIDGDGKPEFICKIGNVLTYLKPDPANPTGKWIAHAISEEGPWPNHGLGVGDVNGDGRLDVLDAFGWWEQPAKGADKGPWIYHPEAFGMQDRNSAGGANMAVYDVNGDGLNDVVTSLQAHGMGLAWFEQKKDSSGKRSFVKHMIMGDFSTQNAGGVTFSELHGSTFADINGDGIPDYVTGKRYWSHLDSWLDPDPYGDPVLYVYRTVRNPKAPGGAEFVPELVHNQSGVGSDVTAVDLNKDGAIDIIVATKLGAYIFWNKGDWKNGTTTTSRASR
jgi:hypothetical protein